MFGLFGRTYYFMDGPYEQNFASLVIYGSCDLRMNIPWHMISLNEISQIF